MRIYDALTVSLDAQDGMLEGIERPVCALEQYPRDILRQLGMRVGSLVSRHHDGDSLFH